MAQAVKKAKDIEFYGGGELPSNSYENSDYLVSLVLHGGYKDSAIYSRKAIGINASSLEVVYYFPHYPRTLDVMGHVSANQMCEAMTEGGFCLLAWLAVNGSAPTGFDPKTSQMARYDWIFLSQSVTYRRMLKEESEASLTFEALHFKPVRLMKPFWSFRAKVRGFLRGEFEWVIEREKLPTLSWPTDTPPRAKE